VAQLPTMLHEELGLENEAEATEIFKRSSMESILDTTGNPAGDLLLSPGQSRADYFKNLTFGPVASGGFPGGAAGPLSAVGSASGFAGLPGGEQRRRTSYLGLTDWPLSAGAIGTGRPETLFVDEEEAASVTVDLDDYFSSSGSLRGGPWNIPGGTGSAQQRLSRRHSLVAPEGVSLEEHFGQLGFGSVPKGSSPPRHGHLQYGHGHGSGAAAGMYHQGYGSDGMYDFEGMMYGSQGSMMMSAGAAPYNHGGSVPHLNTSEPPFQLSSYTGPLWAVEFKSGRTEIFYVAEADGEPQVRLSVGDLVIVEADRGEDLGRVTAEISMARMMRSCMKSSNNTTVLDEAEEKNAISAELAALLRSKEIIPKRIHRPAQPQDLKLLQAKAQEEALAMVRCQSRIRQKKLPMDVVDAEYQWDRNKLTFYFVADRRIDFRELVRDLFRIYKTRIWMCAVDKTSPRMINYLGGLVPVHSAPIAEEHAPRTRSLSMLLPEDAPPGPAHDYKDASFHDLRGPSSSPSVISYKSVASHEAATIHQLHQH